VAQTNLDMVQNKSSTVRRSCYVRQMNRVNSRCGSANTTAPKHSSFTITTIKGQKVKGVIFLYVYLYMYVYRKPINRATERHLPYGLHNVTCLPSQVNVPRFDCSLIGRYSFAYSGGMKG